MDQVIVHRAGVRHAQGTAVQRVDGPPAPRTRTSGLAQASRATHPAGPRPPAPAPLTGGRDRRRPSARTRRRSARADIVRRDLLKNVAANGYPRSLPTDATGNVEQNPWAFFPLYPLLVRVLMILSGATFPVVAAVFSALCGAAATLLVYRLVAEKSDRLGARLAVLCISSFTCTPVFLMAYAEGLALTLVVATLLAFRHQRYGLATLLVLLLGLTRGVVLPLAALFGICAVIAWRRPGRRGHVLPSIALAVWAASLAFLWPGLAGLITGRSDAYVLTQAAWNPEIRTLPVLRFLQRSADAGGESGSLHSLP